MSREQTKSFPFFAEKIGWVLVVCCCCFLALMLLAWEWKWSMTAFGDNWQLLFSCNEQATLLETESRKKYPIFVKKMNLVICHFSSILMIKEQFVCLSVLLTKINETLLFCLAYISFILWAKPATSGRPIYKVYSLVNSWLTWYKFSNIVMFIKATCGLLLI